MAVLVILSRWLHVMAAVLAIGGTFFMRVILPLGLAQADAASRDAVFLRCRRAFKMVIHICVLLLLLTGAFNTWRNWGDYRLDRPLMHALWGPHMLLGVTAMVIALLLLAPKQPPKWHRTGAAINLIILFVAVLLASTLKYVRDKAIRNPPSPPPAAAVAPAADR
jgi:uncharacterized membrane protein